MGASTHPTRFVRPARGADLPRLAEIQTETWQSRYRGQVPDRFLDAEVPGLLRQHWSAWPVGDWRIFVAVTGAAVQGFVALDMDHEGGPYVDNLHVALAAQGQGLGHALLAAAAREAQAAGRLWLTVMEGNAAARAFYRHTGGQEGAAQDEALFGTAVRAFPVHWEGAALERVSLNRIRDTL